MDSQTAVNNPFMLLVNPEAVIAAMEKSERLDRLERHLCRPLDRVLPGTARETPDPAEASECVGSTDVSDADDSAVDGGVTLS